MHGYMWLRNCTNERNWDWFTEHSHQGLFLRFLPVTLAKGTRVKRYKRKIMSLAFLPTAIVRMTFNMIFRSRSVARLFQIKVGCTSLHQVPKSAKFCQLLQSHLHDWYIQATNLEYLWQRRWFAEQTTMLKVIAISLWWRVLRFRNFYVLWLISSPSVLWVIYSQFWLTFMMIMKYQLLRSCCIQS